MYRQDCKTITRIACVLVLLLICGNGVRAQSLLPLYNFTGIGGAYPHAPLVQGTDGNLYGTTNQGGRYGSGTVFKITLTGKLTTLHHFSAADTDWHNADGAIPLGGLLQASDGNFYGTTESGGANGTGTIFRISPSGAFSTLYTFSEMYTWQYLNFVNTDGAWPQGTLVQASDGNLYGTTGLGGAYGSGTIFKITLSGAFASVYAFQSIDSDGDSPLAGLVAGPFGLLYGTTEYGGRHYWGTVFSFNPNNYQETPLWHFTAIYGDGGWPLAGLTVDKEGNLYGTTSIGGYEDVGTIFRMGHDSTGQSWYLETLYDITDSGNGYNPAHGLTLASDGYLYGAMENGGAYDKGVLFKLALDGTLINLHTFSGYNPRTPYISDGAYPVAALVQVNDGDLYGTTTGGGTHNRGTIYRLTYKPVVTRIFPASKNAGAPGFWLTLKGVNFQSGSIVLWNGTNLPTVYGSSGKLTARVDASLVANPGAYPITVVNPDASLSTARTFVVYLTTVKLLSATLTRNPASGDYTINMDVKNLGYKTAGGLAIIKATLGAASTTTALPVSLGNLAAGAKVTPSLAFSSSAGLPGAIVTLKVSGTLTGGTFSGSLKVTLP